MINLLVQPDDEIEIKFIVAEDNNGKVFADHNKEALIEILKHADYKMEEHKAVFKRPSFKDLLNLKCVSRFLLSSKTSSTLVMLGSTPFTFWYG